MWLFIYAMDSTSLLEYISVPPPVFIKIVIISFGELVNIVKNIRLLPPGAQRHRVRNIGRRQQVRRTRRREENDDCTRLKITCDFDWACPVCGMLHFFWLRLRYIFLKSQESNADDV